ncbi:hypothetical protein MMC30_001509 [Trapelia coarctata]|nr:hypothetical protein [Trapelia coarctata]
MGKKRLHEHGGVAASEERAKRRKSSIDESLPAENIPRTQKFKVEKSQAGLEGSNGAPSAAAKHLAYLAQLSSELFHDQQLKKDCIAIAGYDTVMAALNLGQVLRSNQSVAASVAQGLPAYDKRVSDNSGPYIPGQAMHAERISTLLPDLPPILDPSLAKIPFTHRWTAEKERLPSVDGSYERLEFVGDAYIELFASRLLYPRFPQMSSGRLSQLRELLVKNETLAQFSLAYNFDEIAEFPLTHKQSRGNASKLWTKTLGDIFEAYVAALILSDSKHGFATAEAWLVKLWIPKLQDRQDHNPPEHTAAKQDLAGKILTRGAKIDYRDESQKEVNKEGKIWFKVGVYFTGLDWENRHLGSGKGLSKTEAGIRAAMEALSNPLTAQIGAVKRDFDAKVKQEREQQSSDSFQHEG